MTQDVDTQQLKVPLEELERLQERYAAGESIVRDILARVPPAWRLVQKTEDGAAFVRGCVQVIVSAAYQQDGRVWVHVSACGRTGSGYRLPEWDEMKRVKHDFIGAERWAYQVFPAERDYVNLNPYVLHLFALLGGEPALPDFTKGTGSL
jgi:hypothetical protein